MGLWPCAHARIYALSDKYTLQARLMFLKSPCEVIDPNKSWRTLIVMDGRPPLTCVQWESLHDPGKTSCHRWTLGSAP